MNKKLYAKLLSAIICGSIILPTSNYSYAQESSSNVIENIAKDTFTLTEEDYKTKNASELAELVRTNKIKSEDLVKISYSIIKKENPELNVVISTREEEALEEARKLDLLTGEERNKPFFGVPTLMKGIGHNVKGQPSTYGYTYNKDAVAKNDSRITSEFRNLGFVILGTTNYPEGAMRNITDSILYGPAKNPLNPDYNTGGSSGGSAGAVASGMVPIASGSDIGGSIRIPSAWTGLIGLKPTSEIGYVVNFPIVKSATDAEIFFDNTVKLKKELVNVDDIKSLKIGYSLKAPKGVTISDEVIKATLESVEFLRSQGFTVEEIDYPLDGNEMLAKYTHVATSGSKVLDKTLAEKGLTKYDVDPLTWALHIYSKDLNSKDSKKLKTDAKKFLEKQAEIMAEFHKKYPIILTPTTATKAPLNTDYYVTDEMKDILYNFDKVAKEDRYNILVKQWEPMFNRTPFTLISNLTKEPTITLPTYIGENNLPIGVMLNAPLYHDKVLLKFAKFFEEHSMFKMNKAITKIITKKGTGLTTEKPEVHFGNGKGVVIEKPEVHFSNGEGVAIEKPEGKFISGLNIENNNKEKDSTIVLESSNKVVIENKNDTKEENTVKKLPATGIENNSNLLWLLLSNILLISMIFVKRNYKE